MLRTVLILLTAVPLFWSCSTPPKEHRKPASTCNAGDLFCEAAVTALDKKAQCKELDPDCRSLKALLETSSCGPGDRLCSSVRHALVDNKCSDGDSICRSAKDALNGTPCNYTDTMCMSLRQADFTRKNLKHYYGK